MNRARSFRRKAVWPAPSSIPDLEDTYTREFSTWFERELAANFGVRTGVVVRQIRNQRVTNFNANRPFSAFNVPVQIRDPGPDGRTGTSDDGALISGFNLDPSLIGLPTLTHRRQPAGRQR